MYCLTFPAQFPQNLFVDSLKCLYFIFLEMLSEATKILKAEYLVKAIKEHKMDQAIIFCRTKLDCDNIEEYLINLGGGIGDS